MITCTYNPIASRNNEFIGYEAKAYIDDNTLTLIDIIKAMAENYRHKNNYTWRLFMNIGDVNIEGSPLYDDLELFKTNPFQLYSILDKIIPDVNVVFLTSFFKDYYDDDYRIPSKSKIIEDVIIDGAARLIDNSFEIGFDHIGRDDANHLLSAVWNIAGYYRIDASLTNNPEKNAGQLLYMNEFIKDRMGISFAGDVNDKSLFDKLKLLGIDFFTGEYVK